MDAFDIDRMFDGYVPEEQVVELRAEIERLRAALEAVIGHGYLENKSPMAGQDYVSKSAIAKVRAALSK
jgi:ribosomal protein L15